MSTIERKIDFSIKISVIFVFLLTIMLLSGCSDQWLKVRIVSPIDEYRVEMSSVPGLPLQLVFDIDGPKPNITSITYEATKGELIKWGYDMPIEHHGKKAQSSENNIYWIPFNEEGTMVDKAKITVIVTYYDKFVEVRKTFSAEIRKNKNGGYSIQ